MAFHGWFPQTGTYPPTLAFIKEFLLCGVKLNPRMFFPGHLQVLQKGQSKSVSEEM